MRSILVAVVVAVLSVTAFGQPLADKIPADAVLYVGWRGVDDLGKGYPQSHLKAMIELSQFDVMWAQAWPKIMEKVAEADQGKRQEMEQVGTMLASLWKRPVAMAFGGVELKDKLLPKMSVLIDGGADANKIADSLTNMIEADKNPNPDLPVKVRVEGSVVVIDMGLGLKLAADKASSLGGSAKFAAALKQIEGEPVLLIYADGEGLVNAIEQVTNDEAVTYARRLAREEGILAGISCGAAVAVAARLSHRPENAGKTLVVILPDSGERYLSSILFEGMFDERGLPKQ